MFLLGSIAALATGQACGPAPDQAPLATYPSGTILERVGTSDMPITSKSEQAQVFCRQGFAAIHCFWFHEAIRSFRDATKEDPTSAIAWCGLNIALTQPWSLSNEFKQEADYAIRQAIAHIETASPVEQDLIRAFRLRSYGDDDRDTAFERAMTKLVETYPKLNEPRLVWAGLRCQLCMRDGYKPNGDLRGDLEFVAKLIDPVLKRDKTCLGALHYGIHAYEPTHPDKAVEYAIRLRDANPTAPHMLHMPGHIFYWVGRYEDARKAFMKAREADLAYAAGLKVEPRDADWQYGHNLTFLVFDLMEMGRLKEAAEIARSTGAARNVAIRQAHWEEGGGRKANPETDIRRPSDATLLRGLVALEAGDLETAQEKLNLVRNVLGTADKPGYSRVEFHILETRSLELEGRLLIAKGEVEPGLGKLREALKAYDKIMFEEPPIYPRPPHETLGYALIQLGRTDEAVKAFQMGLKAKPNSGWMLYGIALAYEKGNRPLEAQEAYAKFLAAWSTADSDLPQVLHAKQMLAIWPRIQTPEPFSTSFFSFPPLNPTTVALVPS